jgi:hypothetical protein
VLAFGANVKCYLYQAGRYGVSRSQEPSTRGVANLGRTAAVQATDRSALDWRAFATQTIAPMRRTRHSWRMSHTGVFDFGRSRCLFSIRVIRYLCTGRIVTLLVAAAWFTARVRSPSGALAGICKLI